MSETVKLGKVSMTLGGDYNSSQAYDKLTCVYYDGSSWVSRKAVPAGVAPTAVNSAYWQKVSARGAQGPQGQSYVDKALVPIVNDLTTGGSSNVLAAEQGKVLDTKLTELSAEIIESSYPLFVDKEVVIGENYIAKEFISPIQEPFYFKVNLSKITSGSIYASYVYYSDGSYETVALKENTNIEYYYKVTPQKEVNSIGVAMRSGVVGDNILLSLFISQNGIITELSEKVLEAETRIEEVSNEVETNAAENQNKIGQIQDLFSDISVNLLNENDEEFVVGKYLINNAIGAASSYFVTGYIPVHEGITYNVSSIVASYRKFSTIRYVNYYDNDKKYLGGEENISSGKVIIPNNVAFVRFTLFTSQMEKCMVVQGENLYQYIPYNSNVLKESNVTPFVALRSQQSSIQGNSIYELPKDYGRKGVNVISEVEVASGWTADTSVFVGCGYEDYQGWYVEITPTTIEIFQNSPNRVSIRGVIEHGITLGKTFKFSIHARNDYKALYILESDGEIYTREDYWHGGGSPFIYNNSGNAIRCYISSFNSDSTKDIYVYGDSYLSYTGNVRWPYYIIREWNFTQFFMSHKPGIDSEESWPILLNDLSTGNPKYLLWLLGMNDGDDADANTPSESWLTHIHKVIAICEERGITPILATIPTCLIYNEGKNAWVRNSGYRYIDFAKAVGANGDGSWYEGMLNTNNDNVHPTEKGARALAMQVLLDFPEITKR